MKNLIMFLFLVAGMSLIQSCSDKEIVLSKVWETDAVFLGPESIVFDAKRDLLYVSNVNIGDDAKNDDDIVIEFISKVDLEGNVVDLKWIPQINRPTGITIHNDKLYITTRFDLLIANIETGQIEETIHIDNAGFPNDVTVADDGVIYITDSGTNTVYRIENGKVEPWLVSEEIAAPNGLLYDGGKLIIGVNRDNYLKSIDIATKEIEKIVFLDEGTIDGIVKYGSDYLVSHVKGNIYLVSPDGDAKELLNTRTEDHGCADIGFAERKRMIFAPVINQGTVAAYKF